MLRRTHHRRRAFSLIEMTLSLAVAAVIMGALTSAIVLAGRALPGANDVIGTRVATFHPIQQLESELFSADSFSEWTATTVTFTVSDRDNDATPETIRWSWSGTPGAPLTRRYNSELVEVMLDDVTEFGLSYDLISKGEQLLPDESESAETLLISYELSNSNFEITNSSFAGQYFLPTLPGDAVSWKVTRVKFQAKKSGSASGLTMVQLRPAETGNLPGSTVLEEFLLLESTLSNFPSMQEFSFSNVSGLSPSSGLCLVLQPSAENTNVDPCIIRYDNAGGAGALVSTNGGSSWTNNSNMSMEFYVYGTVTTSGSPPSSTLQLIRRVSIHVDNGPYALSHTETSIHLPNNPEVTVP